MQLTQKQLEQVKRQYRLSPRETQIVDLILQGIESNENLAKNLGIELSTTKLYLHNLYGKMRTSTKLSVALIVIDSIQE